MSSKRKRRRADGTLRPTYRRYRAKKHRERIAAMTLEERAAHDARQEQRREWVANFKPAERQRFFKYADLREVVWLKAFSESIGLPQEDAWPMLQRIADERHWRKLRTADGMVVGIAPPKSVAA